MNEPLSRRARLLIWVSGSLAACLVVATTMVVAPPVIRGIRRYRTNARLDELVEQRERWLQSACAQLQNSDLDRSIDDFYRAKESSAPPTARSPAPTEVSASWFGSRNPPLLVDGWGHPFFLRSREVHIELIAKLPDGEELVRNLGR